MTTEDAVAVGGLIAGVIAAIAGVAALVLTHIGNKAAERERTADAARRRASIRPRPTAQQALVRAGVLEVGCSNPGGTAVNWWLLLTVEDGVYYKCMSAAPGWVGVHSRGGERVGDALEPLAPGRFEVLASLAEDVDGNLWDLQTGSLLSGTAADFLNGVGAPWGARFS
jgi:hypothetical protein